MAQIAKIETKAEIKSSPAKFYDFYKNNINQFVNILPHVYKSIQSLEGEEGQVGNVLLFEYDLGKKMSIKTKTEAINDGERSITYRGLGGDIMQMYTSYAVKLTVADGCVNWVIECEKANDSAPNPEKYAELAVEMTKTLDAYLLSH